VTDIGRWYRGLASLAAGLVLLFGPPVALAWFAMLLNAWTDGYSGTLLVVGFGYWLALIFFDMRNVEAGEFVRLQVRVTELEARNAKLMKLVGVLTREDPGKIIPP
jgi:hypothetical protein